MLSSGEQESDECYSSKSIRECRVLHALKYRLGCQYEETKNSKEDSCGTPWRLKGEEHSPAALHKNQLGEERRGFCMAGGSSRKQHKLCAQGETLLFTLITR